MNDYRYKILDHLGKTRVGTIRGSTRTDAEAQLRETPNTTIISLNKQSTYITQLQDQWTLFVRTFVNPPKLNVEDQIYFTRELTNYMEAGFPMVEALRIIRGLTKKKVLGNIIEDIIGKLRKGYSLSRCLQHHHHSFPQSFITSIRSGEVTGKFTKILKDNVQYFEFVQKSSKKIAAIIVIPAIVIVLITAVMSFLLFFMIPKIVPYLTRTGKEIPFVTQLMVSTRDILIGYHTSIFTVILFLIIAPMIMSLFRKGRYMLDQIYFKVPVFGKLYHSYIQMKLAMTMEVLYTSGMPLVQSLEVSKDLFVGGVYNAEMEKIITNIKLNGSTMGRGMAKSGFFSELMVRMVKSAEQTGTMAENLKRLGQLYAKQMEGQIDSLLSYIEPLYISIIVTYILLLLFGFYVPMMVVAVPQ
jgi:type II secretory pathway component PulF